MTSLEKRAAIGLAAIFAFRMLGLFLLLPVLAVHADSLTGATPFLIGLAIGVYGLTQASLQIPFGLVSDRIGRKPVIFFGLALFTLGSLIAASSDSIYGVILGRALQGSGAIAAAVMALAADLTRDEVRTRVTASIAASIALAFALALVLGPALADHLGLDGVFYVIAGLAVIGIAILATIVPTPERSTIHRDAEPVASQMGRVLRNVELLRLDLGMFTLHLTMTSLFVVFPLALVDAGLAAGAHWRVYLPVVLASFAAMVPFILLAERSGKGKPVFVSSVATLALSMIGLYMFGSGLWPLALLLLVFFTAINLLEAQLPSLVGTIAPAAAKGTAMGVFSTSQFIGAFCGGVFGGLVHQHLGADGVYLFAAAAATIWLAVAWSMAHPPRLTHRVVRLTADGESGLRERLLGVPGVVDVSIVADEGLAYVKVDNNRLDSARLSMVTE